MNDEPKPCAHCGGGHVVGERIRQDDRTDDWTMWRVMCGKCGISTDWHGTREAAIAVWNTRADKFGADDDYERRMDELLCRLTNGKWSKSRSYSVDFMVSCVDEAYDEILDPPVERHYAPRNTRADDAPELLQDDACAILRRVAADKTAVSSDDLLRYAVGVDMVPEALNKIADMIERDYVRRDSIADDAPEHTVDNQADSRERLEADVYDGFSDVALSEQMRDVLRSRVHAWLDRQALIAEAENEERECTIVGAWDDYATKLEDERSELQQQVDNLTAERDNWANCYDMAVKREQSLLSKIDELNAEVEAQRKRANDAERGVLSDEWYVSRDRYEDDIAELKADVKKWADAANEQRLVAMEQADKVQELTAERDDWKTKCETLEFAYKQADAERKRHSEQIDELFSERDELREKLRIEREAVGVCEGCDKVDSLTAERDYWKDQVHQCVIKAVEPGGYTEGIMRYPRTDGYCEPSLMVTDAIDSLKDFYADEKRINDKLTAERDELRDKLDEKQRVCDTQRESFRKMEKLLADAKAAYYAEMRDEAERLSAENARIKAENRELCMKVYGAPF